MSARFTPRKRTSPNTAVISAERVGDLGRQMPTGQTPSPQDAVAGKARPQQISYRRPEIFGFFGGWRENVTD